MNVRPERDGDPEIYVVIGPSAIAHDGRGEILETVEWSDDGRPDWTNAGICDHRGGGGQLGYSLLAEAVDAAEENARMLGFDIQHVSAE